jgi:hypothetical protein
MESQVVTGASDLGDLQMNPGVVLSGTVLDFSGSPLANIDIDADYSSTGLEAALCGDSTAVDGSYSVIVPTEAVIIEFSPSFTLPLAGHSEALALVANTLLDVVLQPCPFGIGYGQGLPGTNGLVPRLTTSGGVPRVGNGDFRYRVERALPGTGVLVINSLGALSINFLGGTIVVDFRKSMSISRFRITDPTGVAEIASPLPPSFLLGVNLFSQALVSDPMTPQGWAMSRGLITRICP